ncbi:MAG TPA: hypothetical protein VKD72_36350, partial [Gemmataceae bacterium]|nr:hypothetical protein [Gemmataceae bacterium]
MYPEQTPAPTPPPHILRERISLPGIFLAVVGGINVLAAGLLLMMGNQASRISPDDFEKEFVSRMSPQQRRQWEDLKQEGWTAEKLLEVTKNGAFAWGGVALVCGLVTLLGGIRMAQTRSYGLAMTGAILAAIPFLSPLGCCLIGVAVGIWALVVLFNSDVQAAFS